MLFRPKQFVKENGELFKDEYELTSAQLQAMMKLVNKERTRLRTRAVLYEKRERVAAQQDEFDISKLAKKIKRGHYSVELKDVLKASREELSGPVSFARTGNRRSGKLSLASRIHIAHEVLLKHQLQGCVARSHGISTSAVSRIVTEFKKNDGVFQSRVKAREDKANRKKLIEERIRQELSEFSFIDSSEKLAKKFKDENLCLTTADEVRAVLRGPMQLRFRLVKPVNPHCNSERCLVLRQQFSKRFIDWTQSKHRIINIDETWIGMVDFRRMKWLPDAVPRTACKALMSPRVSLIVALDNHGEIYWALNQGNSNAEVMCLFLKGLVTKLNGESRQWRKKTVIYWDGAGYHDCAEVFRCILHLDIPIAMSGPYSYDTAPCELLFAEFKSVNINPRELPTGKK